MNSTNFIKAIGIPLIASGILFVPSCSNSPENLKVIPESTNAVSVVDIYSIAKKGKLTEISDLNFFKTAKKELRKESKKTARIIENLIEDPTAAGIDFTSDIFTYYVNDAKDEQFVCVSAALSNDEKFTGFLEKLLDENDIDFDIEEEKTYKFTKIQDRIGFGWDEDKVVMIFPQNYSSREHLDLGIENLFSLKEKNQITENKEFNNFYAEKKDVSIWLSTNLFEDNRMFEQISEELDYDLTDNYISAFLNFEEDKISLLTSFSANEEIEKLVKENHIWENEFNEALLKLFPAENYALGSVSVNPMAYYSILMENDDFEQTSKQFKKNLDLDMKEVFQSINGNVIISLFDAREVEYSYKGWGYSFNEETASKLDQMYTISEAGYLSEDDKNKLNEGETIESPDYRSSYCINIKNVLEKGGNIESAIANDSKINWYRGGWEYGKNIETTKEEVLPIIGMAFDINGSDIIKTAIDKAPADFLTKVDGYYEFKFDNKYPSYLAFNDKACFITNDKKSIEKFKNGGYENGSLASTDTKDNVMESSIYTYLNLNYDDYPKAFKKQITVDEERPEGQALEIWKNLAQSIEFKRVNDNSVELIFSTKKFDENSLQTIISTIDNNYEKLLAL